MHDLSRAIEKKGDGDGPVRRHIHFEVRTKNTQSSHTKDIKF